MARRVNQEKDQVAYGHIETHSLQSHHLLHAIDERDATLMPQRAAHKHIPGHRLPHLYTTEGYALSFSVLKEHTKSDALHQ